MPYCTSSVGMAATASRRWAASPWTRAAALPSRQRVAAVAAMRESGAGLESAASTAERIGVLLSAGVAPVSALRYLADAAPADIAPLLDAVAASASAGVRVPDAILDVLARAPRGAAGAWRGLAAAWAVAEDAGAPLASTLRGLAGSLRQLAGIQQDIEVALSGPVATARLMMALPVVAVLFGSALGFDTLPTLFGTVPGLLCLAAGAVLLAGGAFWNRRLCAAARPVDLTPGLRLDLMAVAVGGGASPERARASVAAAVQACGVSTSGDIDAADAILSLSERAGVPAAALLRSEAALCRSSARREAEMRSATLGVKLMLPLGLCVLPAFMLLGVAPLLLSVISSTIEQM